MPSTLTQQRCPDPTVDGSGEEGWKSLPNIPDASLSPKWVVNNDKGAYLASFSLHFIYFSHRSLACLSNRQPRRDQSFEGGHYTAGQGQVVFLNRRPLFR